jgi:aminoglycoside 2'-N-acetyltransferase I
MTQPTITILTPSEVTTDLQRRMDELSRIAFAADADDPELAGIEWVSSSDWFVLVWMEAELVSELCLLRREINVGEEKVRVVGVGGVATQPRWQRQGLATALLRAAETHIKEKIPVPFGLLVCSTGTRPLYEGTGWQHAADELVYLQNGERRLLKASVMILPLTGRDWPSGTIDLCGSPW